VGQGLKGRLGGVNADLFEAGERPSLFRGAKVIIVEYTLVSKPSLWS